MGRISRNKRGQQAEPLNWIYILIAGAIILMFFIGIVVRQKSVSEQRLSSEISEKLSGIFTGALLSEETTNVIDIPEVTINFVCDDDGYSEFNIEYSPSSIETPFQPIFALPTIQSSRFILWSVAFNMPFTSGNLLMVSSPNTRIIVITDNENEFWTGQRDALEDQLPDQLNVDFYSVDEYDSLVNEGDNHVRFVFLDTLTHPKVNQQLPGLGSFDRLGDDQISAVSITGQTLSFYQKEGTVFRLDKRGMQGGNNILLLPSGQEKNPALLGAIFAGNGELYTCNMRKVMTRLALVGEVYGQRAQSLKNDYGPPPPQDPSKPTCYYTIKPELIIGEDSLVSIARSCSEVYDKNCFRIAQKAFTTYGGAESIEYNNDCLQSDENNAPGCGGRLECGNIY